jgi:DNA polymerase-3 subunit epsilon
MVFVLKMNRENSKDVVIKEKGRHSEEEGFVLIKNNMYLGYGFIERSEQITANEQLETYLIPQKDNVDVQKILTRTLIVQPLLCL